MRYLLIIIIFHFGFSSLAQTPVNDVIEQIINNTEEENIDYEIILDELTILIENPININLATKDELAKLFFLSEIQINNILFYRNKYGEIITIYELLNINSFDKKTIEMLQQFISLNKENIEKSKLKLKYGKSEIISRSQRVLQNQIGYNSPTDSSDNKYLGLQYSSYTRYRYKLKDKISTGFTIDKDAGEKGIDFFSSHLYLKDITPIDVIAIGDYSLEFGQGLNAWTGFGLGKTSQTLNIKKYGRKIRPYTSSNENNNLRGIALSHSLRKIQLTGFLSKNNIDGNIYEEDNDFITSLQESGYHRTEGELFDKNSVTRNIYGGNINYQNNQFEIGFTGYSLLYDKAILRSNTAYKNFDFYGDKNYCYGFNYNYVFKNSTVFGESSICKGGGNAYLNGLISELSPFFSISVLHRHYSKDYNNQLVNSFSENSNNKNEDGLYLGVKLFPFKDISISGYFDSFKSRWLKFQTDAPSNGYEYLYQVNYSPEQDWQLYFKYKQENKQTNSLEEYGTKSLIYNKKESFRINSLFEVSENIKLKNRIEYLNFKPENEPTSKGYLISQSISCQFIKLPIRFTAHYAIFDTDNYDSRIYSYENDVLYTFSIPSYYYKGNRTCLMLKYKYKNINLWLRYAVTTYSNIDTISENSLNQIDGNKKSEVKVQLRFVF